MSVYSGSRYANSLQRIRKDKLYLTVPNRITFNPENCVMYQFKESDTLDSLADKFYGNSALWWCIMDANREFQSELEIKSGAVLKIPKLSDIREVVG